MNPFFSRLGDGLIAGVVLVLTGAVGCNKVPTATVTGTVTIDGRAVPGVEVMFVPTAKIRPAFGITDETGHYAAQFLTNQSGVPLGDCVVQISYRPGGGLKNVLPDEFNEKASENPDLCLTVTSAGVVFDYDVNLDGPIPSQPPEAGAPPPETGTALPPEDEATSPPEADAPSFDAPIPPSASTTEPAAITDGYWQSEFERVNREAAEADGTQVVFFGDSITLGWSIGKAEGKAIWDERFAKYNPTNMGNSGDITPVMLYRVTHGNLDFAKGNEPKVAVLLCGTNNYGVTQSDGGKVKWDLGIDTPPGDVADGIRAIAQEFRRRLPTTRVIILGILPVKNEAKQAKVQETNRILAGYEYPKDEVVFLDLEDRFVNADGTLKSDLYTDGTHLTAQGYEVLGDAIEPVIQRFIPAGPSRPEDGHDQ